MDFSHINKSLMKNFGSAMVNLALVASPLSLGSAANAYYASRRASYGKNNSYLIDEGLRALKSREFRNGFRKTKESIDEDINDAMSFSANDLTIKKNVAIRELVIVDGNVKNNRVFEKLTRPGVEVVEIPSNGGLLSMIEVLSSYQDLNAVHVFSHGNSGVVSIGGQEVDKEQLEANVDILSSINGALKVGGDLLFYGCDVAKGEKGDDFLEIIKGNTHVDVAASDDLTGNAQYKGDWDLEVTKGDIEAKPLADSIAMKDFTGVLQTIEHKVVSKLGGFTEGATSASTINGLFTFGGLGKIYTDSDGNPYIKGAKQNVSIPANGQSTTMTFSMSNYLTALPTGQSTSSMYYGSGNIAVSHNFSEELSFYIYVYEGTSPSSYSSYIYIDLEPGEVYVFDGNLTSDIRGFHNNQVYTVDNMRVEMRFVNRTSTAGTADLNIHQWHSLKYFKGNIPPVVNSVTKSGSPANTATSVDFVVTFDESANNVSADDFTVTTVSGSATGTVSNVTPSSGSSVTVTVNSITGTGDIRLDVNASTNIVDTDSGNGNGTNGHVAAFTNGDTHSAAVNTDPTFVSATKDSDTQITVTFSDNVQTNGTNPTDFAVTDGTGATFAVSAQADGTGGDTDIVLTVANLSSAVGDLKVTYTNNNNEISDSATGTGFVQTDATGVTIDVDTSAPTLSSATKDSDTQITVTMSEPVQTNGTNPTDFTVTDGVGTTFAVSAQADGVANDANIVLTVANLSTAVGDLKVTYTNNNNEISDFGSNNMATDATGVTIDTDTTAPTLASATKDSNTQITVTLSEKVQTNGTNPTDFTVVDGVGTNFAVSAQADGTANDTDIVLTVADLSGAVGDLKVTYTNNNNEISDFGSNNLATDATGVAIDTDSTVPTLVSAAKDSDTQITVTLSEAAQTNGTNPTDFTVVDGLGTNFAVSAQVDGTAKDTKIVLTVADLSSAVGDLKVTYANNNNEVTDFGGNSLATNATGVSIDTDSTNPTMASGVRDSDTQLTITFSEPVQISGNDPNDFTVTDALAANFAVSALADGTANDTDLVLTVADFSGATGPLTVTYTRCGSIEDFGGNALQDDATGVDIQLLPTIAFTTTSSNGAESTSSADLQVDLSATSASNVTVDYAITGTATGSGTDYTLAAGTLTITAGDANDNITIASIVDDAILEANETVIVTLSNPSNATLGTNTVHTYTITDNDAAAVTIADVSGDENGGAITVTAILDNEVQDGFTVDVSTADGTATTADSDYGSVTSQTLTFAGTAGEMQTFTIIPTGDTKFEANETLTVSQSNLAATSLSVTITDGATVTVNNDDAAPTVAFNTTTSNAGESTTSANLQVDLSATSGQDVMVDYTVTGTATGTGTDYTLVNGTLTISAGDANDNITIASIIADALDENDETVIVTLSNPQNATLGSNTVHTYTILDDDASPTIAFTSTTTSGAESVSSANLQVALSSASGRDVTVDYTVTGTASGSGTDYTLADGTLTITEGNSSNNITIAGIVGDALDEADETVIVTISNPSNAALGTNKVHTYTILDDDATPTVFFGLATDGQSESEPSQDIQVSLSAVSGRDVTVDYAVTGTATGGGVDHSHSDGTITITAGVQDFQHQITGILDDALDEDNETIVLTLSNPTNATLGGQTTHTYTITDNDAEPTVMLSVDNSSINEASGTATLTATLSAVSGKDVTVTVAYSGTAVNGTDYNNNASTSIVINAGSSSADAAVIITPINDGDAEVSETITAEITNVVNGLENGVQSQTITILDDDTPNVGFVSTTSSGAESVASTSLEVNTTIASLLTLTVDFVVTGTATGGGTDYTLANGTLTFNPGSTSENITIAGIVDDAILEANETVIVTLSNPVNVNLGTNIMHAYTINNNDAAAVTIADISGAENGGVITVTATLDNAVEGGFGVDVSTADGTATTSDSDFTAVSGQTLTFAGTAGETQTFTVTPTEDTKVEADETISISQSNLSGTTLNIDVSDGASITINNDDVASVTIADVSGAENGGAITVTATLDNAVQGGFSVDVNTSDGTATAADSDFTAVSNHTLTFAGTAGETQTFTVTPTEDTKLESDETLTLSQGNLAATSLGVTISDQATVTITNDDAAAVTIAEVSGNEDDGLITVTVTLDNEVQGGFTVDANTADFIAFIADSDYTAVTGETLTFAGTAGETQTFTVNPTADTKAEPDEILTANLSNLSGTSLSIDISSEANVIINNDDTATVNIADVSGNEDDGNITVTLEVDGSWQGNVLFRFSTIDGTATTADSDYTLGTDPPFLLIGDPESGDTFTVEVIPTADDVLEIDETLTLTVIVLGPSSAAINSPSAVTVTIINDDAAMVTIEDVVGVENDGAITLSATLDNAVKGGFTVDVNTTDGTAIAGTDYTAVTGQTLTFAGTAGETQNFTVIPIDDSSGEFTEQLSIGMNNLAATALNVNIIDEALVTIEDDDAPEVTSVSGPANGTYGIGDHLDFVVNFTLPITITGTPTVPVTVGSTAKSATLNGTVNNSTTATFRYTVVEGDIDTDGIAVGTAMNLNGGTMKDEFGVDAILILNNAGATTAVLVDGIKPTATLTTPAASIINAPFTVTFSYDEAVSNFELGDITVANGTASNFTQVTVGQVWSATITPMASGNVDVSLGANTAEDGGGNGNNTSNTLTRQFNTLPSDISLSTSSTDENNAVGDAVATISTTDPDVSDNHIYTLVSGTGDTDNGSFSIDGDQLKAGEEFDFETKTSYSIRIKTDDGVNGTLEKVFTFTITNVLEGDIILTGDLDFGPTALGLNNIKPLTMTNIGERAVEVRIIDVPGGFTMALSAVIIGVGESVIAPVIFSPFEVREFVGELIAEHEDGQASITLTGEGVIITSADTRVFTERDIKAYPNPASNEFQLDLTKLNGNPADISILDASGIELFNKPQVKEDSLRINVGTYRQGVYLVMIKTKGSIIRKKVIIRR